MACNEILIHIIKPGDTIYQIANYYQTTVPNILLWNTGVNPYNLQVGTKLRICPGSKFVKPENPGMKLNQDMRRLWEQQAYWTRMLLISSAEKLSDEDEVSLRLMQNPIDIADIFLKYYPAKVVDPLKNTLMGFLDDIVTLTAARRDNETQKAEAIEKNLYEKADELAAILASMDSDYDETTIKKNLYQYVELTIQEISERLAEKYNADIDTFDKIENLMLPLADYITTGIIV